MKTPEGGPAERGLRSEIVYASDLTEAQQQFIDRIKDKGVFIDWSVEDPEKLIREGVGFVGNALISGVDEYDKYSEEFYNCMGVLVTNGDRSFMMHVSHRTLLEDTKMVFNGLRSRFADISADDKPLSVVVFGGEARMQDLQEEYTKAHHNLVDLVEHVMGQKFVSTYAPLQDLDATHAAYFSQAEDRLLVVRDRYDL